MHERYHTIHDGRRTIEQGFQDLIAAKQQVAQHRFEGNSFEIELPRDAHAAACAQIAKELESDGFAYRKSGPKCVKKGKEFTFEVSFSSDHANVAGKHVGLSVVCCVESRRFKQWQQAAGLANPGEMVTVGQLGYLCPAHLELKWELADRSTRNLVVAGVVRALREIAFPFFDLFSNAESARKRIIEGSMPWMDLYTSMIFLMCFGEREEAIQVGRRHLVRYPNMVMEYRREFRALRQKVAFRIHGEGWPKDLAILSRFFDLGEITV